MQIDFGADSEAIIEKQIATGRYANPTEVISAALELLFSSENDGHECVDDYPDPTNSG